MPITEIIIGWLIKNIFSKDRFVQYHAVPQGRYYKLETEEFIIELKIRTQLKR